jgi:hypothetical protein
MADVANESIIIALENKTKKEWKTPGSGYTSAALLDMVDVVNHDHTRKQECKKKKSLRP